LPYLEGKTVKSTRPKEAATLHKTRNGMPILEPL